MKWYLEPFKKYATFTGRSRRKEFWQFVLFVFLVQVVLGVLDRMTGTYSEGAEFGFLGGAFSLFVLIPSIAVTVRRLHDIGRTGWWILIYLLPFIGAIVMLVFMVLDSQPETNQYGPSPKAGSHTL